MKDHGAVRTVGLATSEAVTGDREDACSISAVGDNGVSSGGCRDAVSGAVREEVCACLFVVRSYFVIYTAVPVRLATLPDTQLSTYETNPGDLSPRPCNRILRVYQKLSST